MNNESTFTTIGGTFCIPYPKFADKVNKIKAFIFDWDGVFNDSSKDNQGSSNFSEVDAMGTNMLRFSHWLAKKSLPICAVMSGERNVLSFQYSTREHFHEGYFKVNHKLLAYDHFLKLHNLQPEETAFIFDDVLDLGLAERCGVRIMINHKATPLFRNYVTQNNLADYITGNDQFGVREACELLIGTLGNFDETIRERSRFTQTYKTYLAQRQAVETSYYTWKDDVIQGAEV
jgi:3-deoxy-D-manno-octulosonate 8-phosphate phosphatase (KDO 8-P phosphatase)